MYRAMYASDTGLGITLQCQCTPLSTGSSPEKKKHGESLEELITYHMTYYVCCVSSEGIPTPAGTSMITM